MMHVSRRSPGLVIGLGLLIVVGTAGHSPAQDAGPQRLEEVVVTATRTAVPIEKTTSSVTVIDAATIEAKQAKTVLDVLRDVPGLDVRQSGGLGGNTSIFMRGGNSNHTLVMIDGVQVNSPTTGAFDFADLTIDNIERIEIIRGPQSTLYGSDAIGGVIHVITKNGKGPISGHLSGEFGSFNTFQERAGVSGGTERIDYALTVSRLDTDGISRANEARGNTEDDAYDNTTLSARLGTAVLGDGRIDVSARYTKNNTDLDAGFPLMDNHDSTIDRDFLVLSTTIAQPITSWWDQSLKLSLHDDALTFKDSAFPSQIDVQSRRVDWQNNFSAGDVATFTVGYELEDQEGENRDNFKGTITNNAGYAQIHANPIEPLSIIVGGRVDSNNRFGDETTYKVSGAYRFEGLGATLRSSFGTGFRGPTLNDLFFAPFNNPDLQPEKSEGFDVGVEQRLFGSRLIAGVTYFHNDFDDLIVFDSVTFRPENVSDARVQGIEATLQVTPLENLIMNATYTHSAGRDLETSLRLARRPLNKGSLNVLYSPISALRLNLDLLLVGSSFSDTRNTEEAAGYGVVHLAGSYDVTKHIHAFLRIENLLDQEYEEVFGFGTFGRSAFGGMKLSF